MSLNKQNIIFTLFFIFSTHSMLASSDNKIDKFQVETRLSHSKACFDAYKNVAYSLWKHLCGVQSAGKRDDVINKSEEIPFDAKVDFPPRNFDKNKAKPQEKMDLVKYLLDASISALNRDDENKDVYY